MLSLGFRGNAPEQFTLCKAIIFHCERTKLCQFTPWSSFKAAQKPCCCKAWRRSTAVVWSGAASVAKFTAAGLPPANGLSTACSSVTGSWLFTYLSGFCSPLQDGKLPVIWHWAPTLGSHQALMAEHLPEGWVWETPGAAPGPAQAALGAAVSRLVWEQ